MTNNTAAHILLAPGETIDPARLAAANICPTTGLATDYLNHYNEVAMLLDMLAMMPEAQEEILAWHPITYAEHFHITGYREKELAIAAYEAGDVTIKAEFHAACEQVEAVIIQAQELLRSGADVETVGAPLAATIFELIAEVGLVVNGGAPDYDHNAHSDGQADIDALFD